MSAEFAVILVDSAGHAVRIEKLLVSRGLTCRLIPVPRQLSSDCGVCVRILRKDAGEVKALLLEHKISAQAIEVM